MVQSSSFDITMLLLIMLIGCSWADETCEKMFVPDPIVFSGPGDIKLAYVSQLSGSKDGYCDGPRWTGVRPSTVYQYADLLPYALAQINQNDDILPNITLGFTVLDGCNTWKVNLARVWTLLLDNCHGIPPRKPSGKLIGMVGISNSFLSVTVSGSLAIHHIPHIATQATSDELSISRPE